MRVMPITNSTYAQKQQTNFKSKFVPNKVLSDTFKNAEEHGCRYFLSAVKNLLKDGKNRTIELTGSVLVSRDGVMYTKTKLKTEDMEKEFAGFPHIYEVSTDEMIANDGRLLITEMAQLYGHPDYRDMSKEDVKKEIRKLKKEIFKKN